jgi:sugar phosphate isomerase/epimerase
MPRDHQPECTPPDDKEKFMPSMSIALQLYTVRDETARDFIGTLRRVAEMGYPAVEFAGYGGLSASELSAVLAETGLQAASTHIGFEAVTRNLDHQLDYCQAIGCSALVLPSLPPEQRDPEKMGALTGQLNEIGRRCQGRGIAFGYHNHNFEFVQSGGTFLLDLLLDGTDPALVGLEFDIYWAAFAGVDPVAYLKRHAGRATLLHMKDMAEDRSYTEVGDGTLDMQGICQIAHKYGTRWYIVENDQPRGPSLESARRSLDQLQKILQILGEA